MKALKILCLAITISLAAALSVSATANTSVHAKRNATFTIKPGTRLMFIASSALGQIHKLDHDNYFIFMKLNSIKQILVYTQRPYRLYRYAKKQSLKQIWSGKDKLHTFSKNPPNAVLATQNARPAVVTITHMGIVSGCAVFVFHPVRRGMFKIPVGDVHEVALTIDAVAASTFKSAATAIDPTSGLTDLGTQGLTVPTAPTQLLQHEVISKVFKAVKQGLAKNKAASAAKAKAKRMQDQDEENEDSSADAGSDAADAGSDAGDVGGTASGEGGAVGGEGTATGSTVTVESAAAGGEGAALSADMTAAAAATGGATGAYTDAAAVAGGVVVSSEVAAEEAAEAAIETAAGLAAAGAGGE